MSQLAVELDFLVEEYAGSKGKFPPIKRRSRNSLLIATIEKAHSLVNHLLEQGRLDSLGLVVVDEVFHVLYFILKGPLGVSSNPIVRPSFRLSVLNSVQLTNKVQYLK